MIAPQLNSAIQQHLIEKGEYYGLDIMPFQGYADTNPPFILWDEVNIPTNAPFLKQSLVMYHIYDNKVATLEDIEYHISRFLDYEFNAAVVNSKITMANPSYRITAITHTGGGMHAPLQRDGFAAKSLVYDVHYVYANQSE